MTEYNDWIIWNGGECPMPEGTMGQVQLGRETRLAVELQKAERISDHDWGSRCCADDRVIAYRTVREPEVVREKLQIHQYGGRFVYSFDHVMYADAPRWNGHIAFDIGADGNPANVRIEGLSDD